MQITMVEGDALNLLRNSGQVCSNKTRILVSRQRQTGQIEPGRSKLRLKFKPPGNPFRRAPSGGEDDEEHNGNLAPEDLCRGHDMR